MKTSHDICNAMRDCGSLSHNDIEDLLVCFAAMLQKPSALSDRCTALVVDALDEITGQVYDDCAAQREDVPGFERTYAELDALTIRVIQ
jgi:hypothetical protein